MEAAAPSVESRRAAWMVVKIDELLHVSKHIMRIHCQLAVLLVFVGARVLLDVLFLLSNMLIFRGRRSGRGFLGMLDLKYEQRQYVFAIS